MWSDTATAPADKSTRTAAAHGYTEETEDPLCLLEERLQRHFDQALHQQEERYERQLSSLRALVAQQVQQQCELL